MCLHHSGGPIFHEGLKGWACCQKRVVDFDEFMKIPGCTTGTHSDEKPKEAAAPQQQQQQQSDGVNLVSTGGNVEVYSTGGAAPVAKKEAATPRPAPAPKEPPVEENDPADLVVAQGAPCKRKGCTHFFDGDKDAGCQYHPGEPIFHEGSKGWSCCSRKVLEFDEFLKIKGCKQGKHRFSEPPKKESLIQLKHDWYQTPTTVIMSLFGKNLNKETSKITFEPTKVVANLVFNNGDRFDKEYDLFEVWPLPFSVCLSTKSHIILTKHSDSFPGCYRNNIRRPSTQTSQSAPFSRSR